MVGLWGEGNTSFEAAHHFLLFLTYTHVHTKCSCILFRHTCSWTSDLKRLIPLMWGNSTGVGPQRTLGDVEVQAVLFSVWDPPLESWSSAHTHDRLLHTIQSNHLSLAALSLIWMPSDIWHMQVHVPSESWRQKLAKSQNMSLALRNWSRWWWVLSVYVLQGHICPFTYRHFKKMSQKNLLLQS